MTGFVFPAPTPPPFLIGSEGVGAFERGLGSGAPPLGKKGLFLEDSISVYWEDFWELEN